MFSLPMDLPFLGKNILSFCHQGVKKKKSRLSDAVAGCDDSELSFRRSDQMLRFGMKEKVIPVAV
jgi:hypothetical protein